MTVSGRLSVFRVNKIRLEDARQRRIVRDANRKQFIHYFVDTCRSYKAPPSGSGTTGSPLPLDSSGYKIGSHWTPLPLQWHRKNKSPVPLQCTAVVYAYETEKVVHVFFCIFPVLLLRLFRRINLRRKPRGCLRWPSLSSGLRQTARLRGMTRRCFGLWSFGRTTEFASAFRCTRRWPARSFPALRPRRTASGLLATRAASCPTFARQCRRRSLRLTLLATRGCSRQQKSLTSTNPRPRPASKAPNGSRTMEGNPAPNRKPANTTAPCIRARRWGARMKTDHD